jgi:hypothetical protein
MSNAERPPRRVRSSGLRQSCGNLGEASETSGLAQQNVWEVYTLLREASRSFREVYTFLCKPPKASGKLTQGKWELTFPPGRFVFFSCIPSNRASLPILSRYVAPEIRRLEPEQPEGAPQGWGASVEGQGVALRPTPAEAAESRDRRRHSGGLSLGYFSLAKQRKITRPRAETRIKNKRRAAAPYKTKLRNEISAASHPATGGLRRAETFREIRKHCECAPNPPYIGSQARKRGKTQVRYSALMRT